jgi:hypothetical protein
MMKIYRNEPGHPPMVGEVPDGAICMEIGPQADRDCTITAIDYEAKTYCEVVGAIRSPIEIRLAVPFPERWYQISDVEWKENIK